jgi:hypothetical protein
VCVPQPRRAAFVYPDQVHVALRVCSYRYRLLLVRSTQAQSTAPIRTGLFAPIRLDLARAQEQGTKQDKRKKH